MRFLLFLIYTRLRRMEAKQDAFIALLTANDEEFHRLREQLRRGRTDLAQSVRANTPPT
jgi:hypothetical protein